jgi:hypothetical protein
MARNRPCGVCGKWFRPSARLGDRQHTCGLPACKHFGALQDCQGCALQNRPTQLDALQN